MYYRDVVLDVDEPAIHRMVYGQFNHLLHYSFYDSDVTEQGGALLEAIIPLCNKRTCKHPKRRLISALSHV